MSTEAKLVRRISVLVAGGISPRNSWRFLESDSDFAATAANVRVRCDRGEDTATAISAEGFAALASIWRLAETTGAAMSPTLNTLAEQLTEFEVYERQRALAFAGPRATMRLTLWLPVVSIAMSMLLGFNPIGFLLFNPAGWAMMFVGAFLILIANVWSGRLMKRAAGSLSRPGFAEELLVVALSAGLDQQRARILVTDAIDEFRVDGVSIAEFTSRSGAVARSLQLAQEAGVSVVGILHAEAASQRLEYRNMIQHRAAKLSVSLMLPMGVCVLPAFIALGVLPMMFSILGSSLS